MLLMISGTALSQARHIRKADVAYSNYGYLNALSVYLKVVERGYESQELFSKIANSYYFNAKYDEALIWYEKIFKLKDHQPEAEILLRYAQSLKATGLVEKSEAYYDKYVELSRKKLEGKKLTAKDYLALIESNSDRYEIKRLEGTNTDNTEFGKTVFNRKLFFASNRANGAFFNRRSSWDGMSFLNLYQVEINDENEVIGEPGLLAGDINGMYHESSPVITRDGKTMYFTRSNNNPKWKDNDEHLKIYRAHFGDGKWTNIEDLSINNDAYSTAHPALNTLGTTLYFTSDRPGGYGQSDIYMASIDENGEIGEAKNLGSKINTPGKETFPFVSDTNELYFSSDGHFGLGGLDIFYIKIEDSGFQNLLNLGKPINSYADDFDFGINSETQKGFFSSNRSQSISSDDNNLSALGKPNQFINDNIYSLKELKPIVDPYKAKINGHVTDIENGGPITNAMIKVFKEDGEIYDSTYTNNKGYYEIETDSYSVYRLRASKENYDTHEEVSVADKTVQTIDFNLRRNRLKLAPGVDIAKTLNIQNIFFDFDKSDITDAAKIKLEKLIVVLEDYSDLKINIRSHTDSRGSDAYNLALSKRRAVSTKAYLVKKGIESERLVANGFGEIQLTNHCSNGVTCNEENHLRNRRSEFVVAN